MKAVIMAGGFGTRIQPLTESNPKPMLDIVNIPMMEHILNKLKKAGIKDMIFLLYFMPEIIKDYFGDGSKWDVNISYILPNGDFGTAGAVGAARELLKDEPFIIVSGDLVTDFDFNKIIDFHKSKHSKLTITLTPVENPLQFGVVITDENDKIVKFLEKPSWGEVFSDTINTGIYVLEPEILEYIPVYENYDFSKDLFPDLMKKGITLWGCDIKGYWRDVGNPQSYREVHQDILEGKIKFDFEGKLLEYPDGKLYTKSEVPKSLKIMGNVVIDKDVKLGENVTVLNSSIGRNCEIDNDTMIENSVIWKEVEIGAKCLINNTVICSDNKLGNSVKIIKGAIIAKSCNLQSNVEIIKDITIWSNKIVEEGAIVSQNVVWGDRFRANIFNKGTVVGSANVELTGEIADKISEAYGSVFQEGSKVYVSRDYHHASRMLKRFVVGGLLAVGLDILDLKAVPANVLRRKILTNKEVVGGIHIRQSIKNPYKTEISFYNEDGLLIDSKISDAIQRIYFREQFRRVNYEKIGKLKDVDDPCYDYRSDLEKLIEKKHFSTSVRIVVDLMFGMTAEIYPEILNRYGIDTVMLNAYTSQEKLIENSVELEHTKEKIIHMVKSLELDFGIILYPNGQKVDFVDQEGYFIEGECLLLIVLKLLDMEEKKAKVFLPTWAPDFMDDEFKNIEIVRGKLMGKKFDYLKQFDLLADTSGGFAFTEFGINQDAIYASIKTIGLLLKHKLVFDEVRKSIKKCYFEHIVIPTPNSKKGYLMRKMIETSRDKRISTVDGVKVYENDNDYVLLLPDDYENEVHLYIQANEKLHEIRLREDYTNKIREWIEE